MGPPLRYKLYMYMSMKLKIPKIKITDSDVCQVNKVKCLGIWMDLECNWIHIQLIMQTKI